MSSADPGSTKKPGGYWSTDPITCQQYTAKLDAAGKVDNYKHDDACRHGATTWHEEEFPDD